jgi:hypothetical protein
LENYGVNILDVLLTMIEDIQNNIFSYTLDPLSQQMLGLVETLTSGVIGLAVQNQIQLNAVLNALLDSYGKKDYLLIADLLEFELKPLLPDLGQECQNETLS